jgi:hypothetical protein
MYSILSILYVVLFVISFGTKSEPGTPCATGGS